MEQKNHYDKDSFKVKSVTLAALSDNFVKTIVSKIGDTLKRPLVLGSLLDKFENIQDMDQICLKIPLDLGPRNINAPLFGGGYLAHL